LGEKESFLGFHGFYVNTREGMTTGRKKRVATGKGGKGLGTGKGREKGGQIELGREAGRDWNSEPTVEKGKAGVVHKG